MILDFNKIVSTEKKPPALASVQSIRAQAGREICEIKQKLKLEGFNDNDIEDTSADIFGNMGAIDGCMANILMFSILSLATGGTTPAILGALLAGVEGVSMVRDNEIATRSEKSDIYPEGRNYFIIGDRSLMEEFDLVAPEKEKYVANGDRMKLDTAYQILEMLDKIEKRGISYIPIGDEHDDLYDAVRSQADYLSNKGMFAKGNTVTMH